MGIGHGVMHYYRSLLAELIQARSIINDGGGTLDLSTEMLVWLTLHTDEGLAESPRSESVKLEPGVGTMAAAVRDLPTKEKYCVENRVSIHTDQTPQRLGPLNQASTTVAEASAPLLTKSAPTVAPTTLMSGAQIAKSPQARATQLVEMKAQLPSWVSALMTAREQVDARAVPEAVLEEEELEQDVGDITIGGPDVLAGVSATCAYQTLPGSPSWWVDEVGPSDGQPDGQTSNEKRAEFSIGMRRLLERGLLEAQIDSKREVHATRQLRYCQVQYMQCG